MPFAILAKVQRLSPNLLIAIGAMHLIAHMSVVEVSNSFFFFDLESTNLRDKEEKERHVMLMLTENKRLYLVVLERVSCIHIRLSDPVV